VSGRDVNSPITVAIADDHAVVREGLRMIISAQPDIEVVAEAGDVAGTQAILVEDSPDVLLLDINLGSESGLRALRALQAAGPATAIVILTMQKDPLYAREALDAGAAGYVVKESAAHELVRAIRTAAAGGTYLEPELGAALVRRKLETPDEPLTDRERQVLSLIGLGHTNAAIAEQLFLSVRTVESHRARIQEKLGISGRAQLIRYALDNGLIDR
jgi:two-component system, NarL family, response regulator NreC